MPKRSREQDPSELHESVEIVLADPSTLCRQQIRSIKRGQQVFWLKPENYPDWETLKGAYHELKEKGAQCIGVVWRSNEKLPDDLPPGITHLEFGDEFDQPLHNLPEGLTHLTFSENCLFNQPVDGMLPQSLTHLKFGAFFNQPVHSMLPQSLTHLAFGHDFNRSVDGMLPQSLTHLAFGHDFNQPVDGMLPQSLTHLAFGHNFDQPVNKLPRSLRDLTLNWRFDWSVDGQLPQSLKRLRLGNYFPRVPPQLPEGLEVLEFAGNFNFPAEQLPVSIRDLVRGSDHFERDNDNKWVPIQSKVILDNRPDQWI